MLSGQRIREAISSSELIFTGAIRGNSLTITLGRHLQEFKDSQGLVIEAWQESSVNEGYELAKSDWGTYELQPNGAVLISAREYLRLPATLAGIIGTLSHVARLGLFAHFASSLIGPRYSGYLCLELLNVSGHVFRLREGMPVAKVVVVRTEGVDPERGPEAIPFFYNSPPDVGIDLRSRFFEEFGEELYDESR